MISLLHFLTLIFIQNYIRQILIGPYAASDVTLIAAIAANIRQRLLYMYVNVYHTIILFTGKYARHSATEIGRSRSCKRSQLLLLCMAHAHTSLAV